MKLINARKMCSLLLVTVLTLCAFPSIAFASTGIEPLIIAGKGSGLTATSTSLAITAYTQSYQIEDTISVTSTLQVKSGDSWSNVYTWPTVSSTNSNYVSFSRTYAGTSGKTYRVTSTHYTKKGSTTDTETSFSGEATVY